jgi:uncharacterized protein DUF4157
MSQNAETIHTETAAPASSLVESPKHVDAPATASPHARFQRDLGNAAIAHMLIQRKAEDAASTPAATPAPTQTVAPRIVDDKADAAPGQMHKTEFLNQLRTSVCNAAAEAFRGTRWSEQGCPYIERVFTYCAVLDSERLERGIRRYAPETAAVPTAAELIPLITARVQRSLTTFVSTGQVSGVPQDVPLDLSGGFLGMLAGARLLLKKQSGAEAERAADPQEIQSQLGAGTPLEGSVRSRMESAYGESFGNVEVHADTNAAGLSKDLNARAFTVGQHVAFGTGEYRPGTLIGDALIAHELAHVVQQKHGDATAPAQKGTTDHDSFEEEADHAAVGAVVSTWGGSGKGLAKLTNRAMTSLRSGLRLQRCKGGVVPAEFEKMPTVSPADEELLDRLEGRHAVYAAYKTYKLAPFQRGLPEDDMARLDYLFELKEEMEKELREEGFEGIEDFEAKTSEFESFFQRYAIQVAFQILRENEALIEGESQRYGGVASTNGSLAELKASLAPARAKYEAADRLPPVTRTEHDGLARSVVWDISPEASRQYAQAEELGRSLAPRFPVLADPKLNIRALVSADDEKLQSILQSTASDRLSDIQKTRENLADKPSLVWQMEGAVQRARFQLDIVEGSIYDALIKDKLSRISIDKVFRSLLVGALAIGLGIVSAGTGTAAVLAGAALAGVSIGTVAAHTKEYLIQQAAVGTAFDRARALTAIEPSLGWLALDIAFAVVDLGAAFGAMRALKGTAKAFSEGTATLNDLRQEALAVGKQLADEQKHLLPEAVAAAEQVVKEQKIIVPEAFAESVAAAAKRTQEGKRLLAGSPEAANAIRAAASGLDETVVTGILRLSPEARSVVLTKFAGNTEVLARLGAMAERSEHVVTAVNLLRRNMSGKQFEAILGHYLKSRNIDSVAELLRAIGQAGVDDEAIRAIAATMGKVRSDTGIINKFRPQIREAIADALGPGPAGYKKLLEVTEGLHTNQSGPIFESWATKHIYGGSGERASFDTAKLRSAYHKNPRSSDNWLSSSGTIVDCKHLRTSERFGTDSLEQLEDYASLIRDGATHNGKQVTHIEYLFSSEKAARTNAGRIRQALAENVTIKYIDPETGLVKILQ